jgi:hypothetical protein
MSCFIVVAVAAIYYTLIAKAPVVFLQHVGRSIEFLLSDFFFLTSPLFFSHNSSSPLSLSQTEFDSGQLYEAHALPDSLLQLLAGAAVDLLLVRSLLSRPRYMADLFIYPPFCTNLTRSFGLDPNDPVWKYFTVPQRRQPKLFLWQRLRSVSVALFRLLQIILPFLLLSLCFFSGVYVHHLR